MLSLQLPAGLALVVALGAGSAVWTARIDGKDGSKISGTAQVESRSMTPPADSASPPADTLPRATPASPAELQVTINLSGAPKNGSLSWYLYSGGCNDANAGAVESIQGVPSSYSPVKTDGSGNGSTTVTIRGARLDNGNYYVGVIAGGELAACGNLEPTRTSTR